MTLGKPTRLTFDVHGIRGDVEDQVMLRIVPLGVGVPAEWPATITAQILGPSGIRWTSISVDVGVEVVP